MASVGCLRQDAVWRQHSLQTACQTPHPAASLCLCVCTRLLHVRVLSVSFKDKLDLCCLCCCCCRFVVLVTGTMVYGKGDEQGSKEELEEAMQAALEPAPAAAAVEAERSPLLAPSAAAAVPVSPAVAVVPGGVPGTPSDPIVVRSSFKATMNLMSGSYSRWGRLWESGLVCHLCGGALCSSSTLVCIQNSCMWDRVGQGILGGGGEVRLQHAGVYVARGGGGQLRGRLLQEVCRCLQVQGEGSA
jgi:hypothetical protein